MKHPIRAKRTPTEGDVFVGIAKMKGSVAKRKYFMETMDKYKVALIQYLLAIEEDMIDTLIVFVKPLPRKLQLGGQTGQITKNRKYERRTKANF